MSICFCGTSMLFAMHPKPELSALEEVQQNVRAEVQKLIGKTPKERAEENRKVTE